MDSRRDFLKKAALLAAGGGLAGAFTESIQRAFAIDPPPGTTYLDAEHVVILMQENRSFDHSYGTLRGVRGFNDPRAITLPDGNPVWLQSNAHGETYSPFRLNIKDTKATWMSSLPHSWGDQSQARNGGKHDRWLPAKPSGNKDYAQLPLTLGYYNREDIPFYYALADAFTVCDQNFCSSLTGTTPNRLHLWTGTIREKQSIQAKANVWNSDVDYGSEATWTTFPERLEDAGISWRIYQNELSLETGLTGEEEHWLANFTDNPIEWFTQYQVRFSKTFRSHLPQREKALLAKIKEWESEPPVTEAGKKKLNSARLELEEVRQHLKTYTEENFARLDSRTQNLHRKAFSVNEGDPNFRNLTDLAYRDGETERHMHVPKGDVLHQFREDVRAGKLPSVSWIVAPENFSDHPGAPWYGAWYLSETLDILTKDPEVWKKTIFILCYDENDGYFDHVPPFVPPQSNRPETGKASAGIDTASELVIRGSRQHPPETNASGVADPIGLGFRVPLVIASPWSRGGWVCSQVFDHTSILQLVEKWQTKKTGRPVQEANISQWRRMVCGDLSSVFRPYQGEKMALPTPVEREAFLGSIHQAQFKKLPNGFKKLTAEECAEVRSRPRAGLGETAQEKGTRPACALPYELAADGALGDDRKSLTLQFSAGKAVVGERSSGAPFYVYAPGKSRVSAANATEFENCRNRAYTVSAGDQVSGDWLLSDFENSIYQLRVHGPNGFFREFRGDANDPLLALRFESIVQPNSEKYNAILSLKNSGRQSLKISIKDQSYGAASKSVLLGEAGSPSASALTTIELDQSHGWYDLQIQVEGMAGFARIYAGHVENGRESISDPAMAGII